MYQRCVCIERVRRIFSFHLSRNTCSYTEQKEQTGKTRGETLDPKDSPCRLLPAAAAAAATCC